MGRAELITSPALLTCPGQQWLEPFFVQGDRCRGKLMARNFIWDPAHWRFRAEQARTVADHMTHEEARAIIRRIAMDYDRLAKLADEQLIDQERGAIGDKT